MGTLPTGETYAIRPAGDGLPEGTRLGPIRLQVADLARSIAYYQETLGLSARTVDGRTVQLFVPDATEHLVELHSRPGTISVPRSGVLGLFHFAILLPERPALGRMLDHLVRANVRFGAADHLVSEAVYLWDPDGLGIEVYADRPRHTWRARSTELVMATEPLDVTSVIAAANGQAWNGMPPATTLGHMHLSVNDLDLARRFYHVALGFDLTVWSYPGALFMSAGGYHHHLGVNTWSARARRPNADDARLLEWQLRLPSPVDVGAAEERLRAAGYDAHAGAVEDPWGNRLRLRDVTSEAPEAPEAP
jgi:catechol 2,3-dioxygenase